MTTEEVREIVDAAPDICTYKEVKTLYSLQVSTSEFEALSALIDLLSGEVSLDIDIIEDLIQHSSTSDDFEIEDGNRTYRLVNECEISDIMRDRAMQIYEDVVETDIPESARQYMDTDQWVEDYINNECYGTVMGTYDGNYTESGVWYMFRTN